MAALEAVLAQERRAAPPQQAEATGVMPVPAAARPVRRRPRWRAVLLLLLAAAALVAGLIAAQMGADEGFLPGRGGGDEGSSGGSAVQLEAVGDYDPEGGDGEHPEDVAFAADGNTGTFWTTETYSSFSKSGVGIVVAAPEAAALGTVVVVTDTPGYTARIRASNSETGEFEDVSEEETVGRRTSFAIDTGGRDYRYYLLWITSLDGRAHVNEIRARAA